MYYALKNGLKIQYKLCANVTNSIHIASRLRYVCFIMHTWAGYLFNNASQSTSRTNRVSRTGAKRCFQKKIHQFHSAVCATLFRHITNLLFIKFISSYFYYLYYSHFKLGVFAAIGVFMLLYVVKDT